MDGKPKLTKEITLADFKKNYWLKVELSRFCKLIGVSTVGSKEVLVNRIEFYLSTGSVDKLAPKKSDSFRDSQRTIKPDTLVSKYKNDAATREFFIKEIGKQFRFNAYLRQFTDVNKITNGLTYGDLVKGWLAEEAKRIDPLHKSKIDKQFEYNQFIRDFFANEKGKSLPDAILAWNQIKKFAGAKTYAHFKLMLKGNTREK